MAHGHGRESMPQFGLEGNQCQRQLGKQGQVQDGWVKAFHMTTLLWKCVRYVKSLQTLLRHLGTMMIVMTYTTATCKGCCGIVVFLQHILGI